MSETVLVTAIMGCLAGMALCFWACYYADKHDADLVMLMAGLLSLFPAVALVAVICTAAGVQ